MSSAPNSAPGEVAAPPSQADAWACIDADVHPTIVGNLASVTEYMDESWRKRFATINLPASRFDSQTGVLRRDAETPDGLPAGADPDFVVTDLLEKYGVLIALLQSLEAGRAVYLPGRAEASIAVAAFNDFLVERWLTVDERYRLAITVNPNDPDAAAAEIRRLAPHPGVAAIYLPLVGRMFGDPFFDPIYAAAQEAELPVSTHPGTGEGEFQGSATFAGATPPSYAQRHVMLPQLAQSNLISLVFEGTFERFERLQFVFVEFGYSWVPHVLWRMDKDWRGLRRQVPWVKRSPIEYVREHVRFTSQPAEEPPDRSFLASTLEMIYAEETLLFSSDYPHWDNDFPRSTFAGVPRELRQRILVDNARATLRI